MAKKIAIGAGFLLIVFVLFWIDFKGDKSTPTPALTPQSTKVIADLSEPTRLQGITSSGNTLVKLYFNNPLDSEAGDANLYKIFRPQLCEAQNWHAQLTVTKAELSLDAKIVTLTTAPQAGITYRLTFSGLHDIGGNLVDGSGEQGTLEIFIGTAASQAIQTDEDGISDADEQVGWAVRTLSNDGIVACRDVNSDPGEEDTDGDNVADGIEMGYATDPRSPDTDGDNLGDYEEIYVYFSNPLLSDTDEDGISDGTEAQQLFTSPALKDTDGDGMDDAEEVSSGGRNPRLADLPELRLDLYGNPSIILNMTNTESKSTFTVETTLEQDREEQVDTDNTSTKMSIENTVALHTEVEVGTSHWPPSASAKMTTDTEFKHGYFHETSSNWTSQSVNESQAKFEAATEGITEISYDDGMLWVPMKVTNNSALTFKVKDLRVIAYRMLPNGSFSAVGTLTPGAKSTIDNQDVWVQDSLCADPADVSTCGHVLGPGGEIVLVMGADSLPAQEMKALVQNPSALMFEIGSYSLFQLDDWGVQETVNYASLGESVIQRTGILVIDFGDGTVERYMVATNTQRNADGSGKGVTLKEALTKIIGITDYELCESESQQILCRVKDTTTFRCDAETLPEQIPQDFCPPATLAQSSSISATVGISPTQIITTTFIPKGFWMVAGTGSEFEGNNSLKFNDIRLMNGERISLVYLLDSDGDGIFDREEYLLGTDKNNPDSDGDELSDYQETSEGWVVTVQGQAAYRVFSDPRFSDFDQDFLSDLTELHLQTDPYLSDTDQDGLPDSIDPYPTLPPCVDPTYLSLTAWWNADNGAKDAMGGEPLANTYSNAKLGADIIPQDWKLIVKGFSVPNNKVFRFNLQKDNQYLEVADDATNHTSIHTNQEFTISTWLFWSGNVNETVPDTILTKGPADSATYSLSILADGKLQFTIFRNVHEKKWYCSFGSNSLCDDKAAKDRDYDETVTLTTNNSIPIAQWINVTVSFGGEAMRIYVNGEEIAQKSTYKTWWSGWYKKRTTTNYLIANNDPLLIGVDKVNSPSSPYRGLMDDIQFFIRMLQPDEIYQLYNLGVCTP